MSSCNLTSAALFRQPPRPSQVRNQPLDPVAFAEAQGPGDWALLGESVAVRRLRSQIRRVAPYFRTALIRGEAGSGKECVARAIHALSPGADGPFIVADAGLLAESLVRGDASDPYSTDSAQGGTLYLTPVGELSFGHQAALIGFLRASEEPRGDLRPVDSRSPKTRVLAASDRDLSALAAIGQFREDLYTRLSGVEILVPPLRQRVDDIPTLVQWLLRRAGEECGQSSKLFAVSAMVRLQEHPWPNNLRELERVVAQASLTEGEVIEARHLLALVGTQDVQADARSPLKIDRLHDVMQRHVLEVLSRCGGNKVRAAEVLGISRSTLYRMLGAKSGSASLLV